jgi:flagellar biosynthesis chaperone FliJ
MLKAKQYSTILKVLDTEKKKWQYNLHQVLSMKAKKEKAVSTMQTYLHNYLEEKQVNKIIEAKFHKNYVMFLENLNNVIKQEQSDIQKLQKSKSYLSQKISTLESKYKSIESFATKAKKIKEYQAEMQEQVFLDDLATIHKGFKHD